MIGIFLKFNRTDRFNGQVALHFVHQVKFINESRVISDNTDTMLMDEDREIDSPDTVIDPADGVAEPDNNTDDNVAAGDPADGVAKDESSVHVS